MMFLNMTEEEKAAAVAAEEKVAAEAAAAKAKAEEVDYKAELEKEKARVAQAEHTIVALKKEAKDKGESAVDVKAIEDSIRASLIEEQNKALDAFKVEQAKGSVDEEIAKLSSNKDEQELIKFHYEKSVMKSGFDKTSIASDIQNAYVIANKPRLEKTMAELRQAALSKHTTKGAEAGGVSTGDTAKPLAPEVEAWVTKTAKARGIPEADIRAKLLKNSAN